MTNSVDSMAMCPIQMLILFQFLPVRSVFTLRLVCHEWNDIISHQWASSKLDLSFISKEIYGRREVWPIRGWWNRTLRHCNSIRCDRELKWPLSDFVDQIIQMENTLVHIEMNCALRSELISGIRSYSEGDPVQICDEIIAGKSYCCSCWSPIKIFKPNLVKLQTLRWKVRDLAGIDFASRVKFVNPPLLGANELPALERIRLTWRAWQVLSSHFPNWYNAELAVTNGRRQIREADVFGCWDRQKLGVFRKAAQLNISHVHLKRIGDLRSFIDTASAIGIMKRMGLGNVLSVFIEESQVGVPTEDWFTFQCLKEGLEKYVMCNIHKPEQAMRYFEDYYDESWLLDYYTGSKKWTDTLLPLILAYVKDCDVSKCADICSSYIEETWEQINQCKSRYYDDLND